MILTLTLQSKKLNIWISVIDVSMGINTNISLICEFVS